MMMLMGKSIKVIGINWSPNKTGNTATLIKWVLNGCFKAGSDVELLHVCDYNINYCLGGVKILCFYAVIKFYCSYLFQYYCY